MSFYLNSVQHKMRRTEVCFLILMITSITAVFGASKASYAEEFNVTKKIYNKYLNREIICENYDEYQDNCSGLSYRTIGNFFASEFRLNRDVIVRIVSEEYLMGDKICSEVKTWEVYFYFNDKTTKRIDGPVKNNILPQIEVICSIYRYVDERIFGSYVDLYGNKIDGYEEFSINLFDTQKKIRVD